MCVSAAGPAARLRSTTTAAPARPGRPATELHYYSLFTVFDSRRQCSTTASAPIAFEHWEASRHGEMWGDSTHLGKAGPSATSGSQAPARE